MNVVCCQFEVSATAYPRSEESYRVCVCVLLSVIRCSNNPLHLQCLGRRGQRNKERLERTHLTLDRDKGLPYEHNNKPLVSKKHRKYYDEIGECWFHKNEFSP